MAIHFDTQGPAPDGFHVPLTTEWQGLKTIMDGFSLTTGNGWRINLHLPFAGGRRQLDAVLYSQSSYGLYWSSSPYGSANPNNARNLYLNSSSVDANDYNYRANGFSVRCFKDVPVMPDSSWYDAGSGWTRIYNPGIGITGIWRNQSLGLITIYDGTHNAITIADKNLGATTVWNSGDTLSQANMGNMYQWGNNYGFPSTGTVTTTSSTQVDASDYGPGNYYESSTFITGNADWSNVQNDNLWGGVTQGTWADPMKLHGAIQTFHYKPKWKPGSNTLAYYPLNSNLNDYSGNSRNGTVTAGNVSFSNGFANISSATVQYDIPYTGTEPKTISFWGKSPNTQLQIRLGIDIPGSYGWGLALRENSSNGANLYFSNDVSTGTQYSTGWQSVSDYSKWHLITGVYNKSDNKIYLYVDGVLKGQAAITTGNLRVSPKSLFDGTGTISNIIFENKTWTAQEVLNYYNQTKSNYQSNGGGGASGAAIL